MNISKNSCYDVSVSTRNQIIDSVSDIYVQMTSNDWIINAKRVWWSALVNFGFIGHEGRDENGQTKP